MLYVPASINKRASATINKRLPASINIGIINLAATFSSCLSRVSHPDCRATPARVIPHRCDANVLPLAGRTSLIM
jgi:hypothetical protein